MVKRKNEYATNRNGNFISEKTEKNNKTHCLHISHLETLSPRRTLTTSSLPSASVSVSSPGIQTSSKVEVNSFGFESSDKNRSRTKECMLMYYESLHELNSNFAKFCQREEHNLCDDIVSGKLIYSSTPDFYVEAAKQYIDMVERIETIYNPTFIARDVLTFGSGDCGQLALSDNVLASRRPRLVKKLRNLGVTEVSCGGLHNSAVLVNGKVNTWGCNDEGSLGKEDIDTAFLPIEIDGFLPSFKHEIASGLEPVIEGEDHIVSSATGDCQTLVLSNTGRVYFFGSYKDKEGKQWSDMPPPDDHRKQKVSSKESVKPRGPSWWPVHVYQLPGKCVEIKCGASFNAAIVEKCKEYNNNRENNDESLFQNEKMKFCVTWGLGQCGELARPVYEDVKDSKYKWKEGDDSYACYKVDKIINDYLVPQPVAWDEGLPLDKTVMNVTCGAYHLLLIARNDYNHNLGINSVYASGLNQYGQLGLGDTRDRKVLTRVKKLDNFNIIQVAAGVHHSLCLGKSLTSLYAFGRGDSGQLGITKNIPSAGYLKNTPVPVKLVNDKKCNPSISKISCGGNHNLLLTEDGDVYTWGYGEMGALGHGKELDEYSPRKLELDTFLNGIKNEIEGRSNMRKVYSVVGGGQHSAIILT